MARKKGDASSIKCIGIGIRVSAKDKYAIDLLCRIHRLNLSTLITFMLQKEMHGVISDFDKLWHNNPIERLHKLSKRMPELLNVEEKMSIQLTN